MTYSTNTVVASGSTNTFAVPFPYLQESDVHTYVNGVEVTPTWPTSSTVTLPYSAAALTGDTILIARHTSLAAPDVVFTAGGLDPATLNTMVLQLLYIAQENNDANQTITSATVATAFTAWFQSLPTTLPPVPGVVWNDNNSIAIS